MPAQPVPVRWEVSRDESFRQVVRRGVEQAEPASGHSVHAEVTGLAPGNSYYYRFVADGETSPVGRTRTAPAPGAKLDSLRFAFASCQSWAGGSFAAYRTMAEEDLDLVVHLGDYIYERGAVAARGRPGGRAGPCGRSARPLRPRVAPAVRPNRRTPGRN